ncbi:MAG: DedA family protein [Betaproteobacteria bacterium]|nr:DedA family protein [Betaproteobacteria bacterium]
MTEDTSLWALFAASFLAATLLPGGSEAALFGVLKLHAGLYWPAIAAATLGNTLGGMSSYLIGRLLPAADTHAAGKRTRARAVDYARRLGSPALLAAWVPILGDPLCVAAGWLRLPWPAVMMFMALGKLGRYLFVAAMAT